MKKVMILAVVAALLGISAPNTMAQVPGSSQPSSTTQEDEKAQPSTSPSTQPGSQTGTSGSEGTSGSPGTMSTEYSEVANISELPAAITRSLNEKYPGFKADKAYLGKDGTYKVKVSKGEEKQVLFFDARGEAVKMHKSAEKSVEKSTEIK